MKLKKYIILINFFGITCIVVGALFLLNETITFSLYRTFLFIFFPIIVGIILLIVNKNLKIVFFNTIILLAFFSLTFEIILINKIKITNEKNVRNIDFQTKKYIPQICGNAFINKKNLEIYPLGGISFNNVMLRNKFSNKITIKKSDNFGFKNSKTWGFDDAKDFIFLGDSFTYGSDVAHGESFFDNFKKKYPNSINLGCGGTGPIIQKGIFREYVGHIKPKYLIWSLYLGNDINSDLSSEYNSFYKNYLNSNFQQSLYLKQNILDKLIIDSWNENITKKKLEKNLPLECELRLKNFINCKKYFSIFKLKQLRNLLGLKFSFSKTEFNILTQILEEIRVQTNSWNGKLIINIIPSQDRYQNILHMLDYDSYNNKIFDFLKENQFVYIDMSQYFNSYNIQTYIDGHFTVLGNKLMSKVLIEKINKLDH